ncbi:FAD-dependent oxidoreductase, partial [Streptomyces sp. NPDC003674]
PGRYVCGDHRATGSVQGALASGTRAAREVLAAPVSPAAPPPPASPHRRGPGGTSPRRPGRRW